MLILYPVVRKDAQEIDEIKATKQAVGHVFNPVPFEEHQVKLSSGDSLYVFSDGYIDQFGGPNGKKYKSKNLKQKLIEIQSQDMNSQKATLEQDIREWMGDLDQLDDICVIGVRL